MAPRVIDTGHGTRIVAGWSVLDGIAGLLPVRDERRGVAVLAQPTVTGPAARVAAALHAGGYVVVEVELADGEAAKELAALDVVFRRLNDAGLTRGDTIVAVGGGAATDAAGFVAATYLRGIEAVYVPTTLLAAVDAAIGGKTAVNLGGKNLVGAVAPPALVVIDEEVLAALPPRLLAQGHAEALKAGYVGDPELVAVYARSGPAVPLDVVVARAVALKVGIVDRDLREHGVRAWLNLGHTVGHAVEIVAGTSHGEAVAIGMVAAAEASRLVTGFEWRDQLEDVLRRLGLPVRAAGVKAGEVVALMALDKKRGRSGLRMVVLEGVGRPRLVTVDDATVRAALAAIDVW